MLSNEEKKLAVQQYKERKPAIGIFAIRCTATGRVWVGAARNLDAAHNANWFTLRTGAHRERALQAEWTAQGEPAFTYEILEKLADDITALAIPDQLRERKQHWMSNLNAPGLL